MATTAIVRKGKGEPCKRGERASQTGCIPKKPQGGGKRGSGKPKSSNAKPSSVDDIREISDPKQRAAAAREMIGSLKGTLATLKQIVSESKPKRAKPKIDASKVKRQVGNLRNDFDSSARWPGSRADKFIGASIDAAKVLNVPELKEWAKQAFNLSVNGSKGTMLGQIKEFFDALSISYTQTRF